MRHTVKGRSRPLLLETLEDRTLPSSTPNVIDLSGLQVNTSAYNSSDILVQFRPGSTPQSLLQGTTIGQKLDLVNGLFEVGLGTGVTVDQALAAYRASQTVLSASPDYIMNVQGAPNDPNFAQQWALNNTGQNGGKAGADIHALQAWQVTTGSAKIVVGVMDTGIDYDHPDLYQNIWINQAEIPKTRLKNLVDVDHDGLITFADLSNPINQGAGKITDVNHDGRIDAADILAPMVLNALGQDSGQGGWSFAGNTQDGDTAHPNDFVGWNFVTNTNNPFDDNSHGTHVAGSIGAMGNNGVGVTGVDWQVSLMAVKFLNDTGHGSVGAFIDGLNYSIKHGAKITNNSWSGAANTQVLLDAINNARNAGQIFVAAAGNGASNTDVTPVFPSGFAVDNIVSVAASDNMDHLASFSNYGVRSVSLAAPGVGILSTTPGGTYASWDGTSMSTPLVTGVLALVWAKNPTWTYRQVINQVLTTVDVLPAFQGKTGSGGRLDAAAALGFKPPVVVPQVLGSVSSGPTQNTLSSVRVTFSVPMTTFSTAAVSLIGPVGQVIPATSVQVVANSGGKQFDVFFATQTAPGAYTLTLSTAIHDTNGVAILPYHATFTLSNVNTFSSTQAVPIPDLGKTSSTITVPQNILISRLQVKVSINHTYDSDLYIHLTSPSGTDILLSNRHGGSGDNYMNTLFTDDAATPISAGSAPFSGSFRPETPLSNFNTENAQGVWRLWVEDRAAGDVGTITGWSLVITGGPAGGGASTQSIKTTQYDSGPARNVLVAAQPGAVPVSSTILATAMQPNVVPGDLYRGLMGTPVNAPTPSNVSAGETRSGNKITDDVFSAPESAGEIRATAWLSRLSGENGDATKHSDDLGEIEKSL